MMFKNHILPPQVINNLHCPECSGDVEFDVECMIADNDWILHFDMDLARGFLERARIGTDRLSPAFLFDEGYATWNGFTPTELKQKLAERQEIIALAPQNMLHYLEEMKRWGCERARRLREAGWRKAQNC
ncbi:MAG: hypothetical protein ACLFVT_02165 [Syntrophobacteria bacterium]